jgi:hypothetical protein
MAGYFPDHVDALVWALTDLLVEQIPFEGFLNYYREQLSEARAASESQ